MLDNAVLAVLDSVTWEIDGFALASAMDDTGRFTGLVIPHEGTQGVVTDSLLLVDPSIARRQRREDSPTQHTNADGDSAVTVTESAPGTGSPTVETERQSETRRKRTRFVGVVAIDSQRYGREFTRLQQEVIAHLVTGETSRVSIRVEIEADEPDGFGEETLRTVSENAQVLRFERADFQ